MTIEAPMYSGRVLTEYPTGPDLACIYLRTDDAGLITLRIETGPGPVLAHVGAEQRAGKGAEAMSV